MSPSALHALLAQTLQAASEVGIYPDPSLLGAFDSPSSRHTSRRGEGQVKPPLSAECSEQHLAGVRHSAGRVLGSREPRTKQAKNSLP